MKAAGQWRRPIRRRRAPLTALIFATISFIEGLFLTRIFETHPVVAWLMILPLGMVTLWLGVVGLHLIVSLAARRLWPPVTTPAPPKASPPAIAMSAYAIPPPIDYPLLASARGQCGWVLLRIKVAKDGRIDRYQVIDQTPGGQFERAVTNALFKARLPADADRASDCEMTSLISFVAPKSSSPDWAQERLAPSGLQ